jgi:hypothetical protein
MPPRSMHSVVVLGNYYILKFTTCNQSHFPASPGSPALSIPGLACKTILASAANTWPALSPGPESVSLSLEGRSKLKGDLTKGRRLT